MYGASKQNEETHSRDGHTSNHRVEHGSAVPARPRKYHGAFDGFGVALTSASRSSGALTNTEKIVTKAVQKSAAPNSTMMRCGHVCTLSRGLALMSWIEPGLDHRKESLGVTCGGRSWSGAAHWPPLERRWSPQAAGATAVAVPPLPPEASDSRCLAELRPLQEVLGDLGCCAGRRLAATG